MKSIFKVCVDMMRPYMAKDARNVMGDIGWDTKLSIVHVHGGVATS